METLILILVTALARWIAKAMKLTDEQFLNN